MGKELILPNGTSFDRAVELVHNYLNERIAECEGDVASNPVLYAYASALGAFKGAFGPFDCEGDSID